MERNNQKDNQPSGRIPENNPSKPMDSKREVEQSKDEKTDQDFPGYPHYPAKEDIMDQRTDSHRVDMDVENLPNRNATGVSQRFTESGRENKGETRAAETRPEDDFSDINPRTETSRNDKLDTMDARNAEIGIPQNADNAGTARQPGTDLEGEDLGLREGTEADVTPDERAALEIVSMPTQDEENLRRAAMDTTDFEGEQLNEDSFGEVLTSTDLDIPDETDETRTTSMGQGDEENKYYSLGGDRHDSQEEDPYSGPDRDSM
jgi:hypothetical protein